MQSQEYRNYFERLVIEGKFKTKESLMEYIILSVLHFESTEEQKNDRLDFKAVSIVTIKDVLDAVYLAGQMSSK